MRILLVDDHAVFRHGLKDILQAHFKDVAFGESDHAEPALDRIRKESWDLVLLDVSLPGRSGIDLLREIHLVRPALPVLVLSMHPEEQYAIRTLQAGASGYITKLRTPYELVQAVQKVVDGGVYVSSAIGERLASQIRGGFQQPAHDRLSEREFQVLRLIAGGKTAKSIAQELFVSIQTISTHRARILKKLGLRTTAELIRYALENQLIG